MAVQKVTSKAATFVFNGVTLSINSVTPKHKKDFADDTASDNYDQASDLIHKSQQPVAMQTELAVEGYFDLNSTNLRLIVPLFLAGPAQPVVINLGASTVYGHGNFDVTEFELDIKIAPTPETIGFKATLMSNRVFTPGS